MRLIIGYLLSALIVVTSSAQAGAQVIMRQALLDVDVHPDGSSVQTFHLELEATNDAAAERAAQQPITYSSSREDLTILEAYTKKPDGTRLPVDPGAIHAQLVPGSPNLPLFNDQERKVVVFPSAAAHDLLVYTSRREVRKPLFPGQFTWQVYLNRLSSWQDYRVTITAPASLPLRIDQDGMSLERERNGELVIYRLHAAYPRALLADPAAVGPFQRLPRAFASSLADYSALARAYATLALPKEAITPEIQRLADNITDGIPDRKDQAHAIYDWVSKHIRYVAVWLAQGAIEPHDAFTVLEVGYGDCKDHAVLFSALLSARGIASEPVLINFGNEYVLPGPPTLAVMNHVITWLPEFAVYVDTTAAVAPFGVLPFQEYGKPAVHAGATGPAVRRTPTLPPNQASEVFVTKAALSMDGLVEGESSTVASGPFAISLRLVARGIDQQGQQRAARAQLKLFGEEGSGSFAFPATSSADGEYRVSGHFRLDARPELLDGRTFSLPVGLRLLVRPGDLLIGPLSLRDLGDAEPTPCYAGKQIEDISLALPEGWRVSHAPQDVRFESELVHFETRWKVAQRLVSVRRELTSTATGPLCDGETRRQAAQALAVIRRDQTAQIGLAQE
jgi:transglutaminase-like putative cysteine protease